MTPIPSAALVMGRIVAHVLFDLPPAFTPTARGTASRKFIARIFHLTEAGELACIDSREVSLFAARRLECRAHRSDALDVEIYPADGVPPVPDGVKAIPRLRGAKIVRIDPADLFAHVKRTRSEPAGDAGDAASDADAKRGPLARPREDR